ncbi:uncharacterized protein [Triticum aestivum]|uniref:uncharacterized protein n=1 Tax=Triticum aestivum TaxID=4565 RepID=UPI001D0309A8|nr:uncharacterized protein LOC123185247 [Triticum aestivum]
MPDPIQPHRTIHLLHPMKPTHHCSLLLLLPSYHVRSDAMPEPRCLLCFLSATAGIDAGPFLVPLFRQATRARRLTDPTVAPFGGLARQRPHHQKEPHDDTMDGCGPSSRPSLQQSHHRSAIALPPPSSATAGGKLHAMASPARHCHSSPRCPDQAGNRLPAALSSGPCHRQISGAQRQGPPHRAKFLRPRPPALTASCSSGDDERLELCLPRLHPSPVASPTRRFSRPASRLSVTSERGLLCLPRRPDLLQPSPSASRCRPCLDVLQDRPDPSSRAWACPSAPSRRSPETQASLWSPLTACELDPCLLSRPHSSARAPPRVGRSSASMDKCRVAHASPTLLRRGPPDPPRWTSSPTLGLSPWIHFVLEF